MYNSGKSAQATEKQSLASVEGRYNKRRKRRFCLRLLPMNQKALYKQILCFQLFLSFRKIRDEPTGFEHAAVVEKERWLEPRFSLNT